MAARKWTDAQRMNQSRAIARWKPWESSTGPRTPNGKAASSENSFRHGCFSMMVKRLRHLEREVRRSRNIKVTAIRELEAYRWMVEKRIADNVLEKQDPKILFRAFGFLSAEISRTSRTVLKDLGFEKDLPGGPGAFLRKFEWQMAVLRANTSFAKKRESKRKNR